MYLVASILLVCWSLVGSFDSSYYHQKKFSLHLHSESFREHVYHTVRSVCYPVIIFSLFYKNYDGIILWSGIGAIIIDTTFFVFDALEEKHSRKKWGGLSHGEYIIHLFSNTFHYCAITTILLSKLFVFPQTEHPQYLSIISIIFVIGGTITAIRHIGWIYKFKFKNI